MRPGFRIMALPTGDLLKGILPILLKGAKAVAGIQFPDPKACGDLGSLRGPPLKEEAREAERVGGRACGMWVRPDGRSK